MRPLPPIDPDLDLCFERLVDASAAQVFRAWTDPAQIVRWFTPRPWRTTLAEVDLRAGGRFRTVMEGPNGERHDGTGIYLEVIADRRLVWTDCLTPGYRPSASPFMTGWIELIPAGRGTRYIATALHASREQAQQHAAMGFAEGWNKALDQLLEILPRG